MADSASTRISDRSPRCHEGIDSMRPDDLSLSSVNWEHGMLLSPDHFLRQERYVDSSLLWILRYATDSHGLVGGGPRVANSERGAVRHDPVFLVDEDADS